MITTDTTDLSLDLAVVRRHLAIACKALDAIKDFKDDPVSPEAAWCAKIALAALDKIAAPHP